MTATVVDAARVLASGHCPECAQAGQAVLLAPRSDRCAWHSLETARSGQVRLVVPARTRGRYATGVQVPCVACAAAGVEKQGMPNRDPEHPDDALCIPCWTSRKTRRARQAEGPLKPRHWAALDALAVSLEEPCEVCGRVDAAGDVGAVRRKNASAADDRPCWRCGYEPDGYDWLAQARKAHERDQAEAAADEQRVAELADVEAAARAEVAAWRARLVDVQGWVDRLQLVTAAAPALTKTGSGGALQVRRDAGRRYRPVFLIADFLFRFTAAREAAGVAGGRGRPPKLPLVAAVMALDAELGSGRRSMAGLDRTVWLAGVSERTVTNGWEVAEQVRWAHLVEAGGACTLAERYATGRRNRRAVYDLRPLHRSRIEDYGPYLGAAAALVAQLLHRALQLVDEVRAELVCAQVAADDAAAAAATARAAMLERIAEAAAWQAELSAGEVSQAWAADAADMHAYAHGQRGLADVYTPRDRSPLGLLDAVIGRAAQEADRPARKAADRAADQAIRLGNFCYPPVGSKGELSTSGSSLGLLFSPDAADFSAGPGPAGGRRMIGASRSSTSGVPDLDRVRSRLDSGRPPRTAQGSSRRSRRVGARPEWSWWAKPLAQRLQRVWPWLAGERLPAVAATLGARLGPDWTAETLVAWVRQQRGRPLMDAPDSPLAYLAAVLDEVLATGVAPPVAAAGHAAHRRALVARQADALRVQQRDVRAGGDVRDAHAVPSHANAEVQALRARWRKAAAMSEAATPATTPVAEYACEGGCHSHGSHVEIRIDPWSGRRRPLCPSCWDSISGAL